MSESHVPPPLPGAPEPPPLPTASDAPAATPSDDLGAPGWDEATAPVADGRCPVCGAALAYGAAEGALVCGSCGYRQEIEHDAHEAVSEHSYEQWLAGNRGYQVASIGGQVLACDGCGARTETKDVAGRCQFCGGNLVAVTNPDGVIAPEGVLPFTVDSRAARDSFRTWVRSRWFAPGALKKVGDTESIRGTYLPHWTFDAQTFTEYAGQRGDHYTERQGDHEVRRTRWSHRSGHVRNSFDDLLVPASTTLPTNRVDALGPWALGAVKPYKPDYLVGHSAVRYDVDPQRGYAEAKERMDAEIRSDVKRAIGGDEQRISHLETRYADVLFKLVLLPIWIATFMYAGKQWQVMVNANTGEVVGERPYSIPKIVAAVVLGLVVAGVVWWLYNKP
ncbi:hypothetical protein [Cellulomonas gilvus]|uniref:Uncharacterized protein n=1 Tax=Cellulomonas gilvus (strain ATCC 13127 / NRRL B-14078) TaxID=593907 RepID=F8A7V3_CELGA|nr:hypothetical protein [Cellulomonas gilvus]AEI13636.1 hypothetical protein Celgi_3145 [Cellulomonas gilvus ATCC 13127]